MSAFANDDSMMWVITFSRYTNCELLSPPLSRFSNDCVVQERAVDSSRVLYGILKAEGPSHFIGQTIKVRKLFFVVFNMFFAFAFWALLP